MKNTAENIKTFLKYSHHVLGISHVFQTTSATPEADEKRIFNFYYWPESKMWKEFSLSAQEFHKKSFQNLFVFINDENRFESRMHDCSEMISKMNQALGGADRTLLMAWITANAEHDFFQIVSQWPSSLKIIIFREEVAKSESENKSENELLYMSGAHKVLETVSPLVDPNDQGRKRRVWNDFKKLLAF